MVPFAGAYGAAWTWKRPRLLRRSYELRAGESLLATLEMRALLRADMQGRTASHLWRLRHEGLFRGRVRVVREGARDDEAIFRPRWFGAGDITTRSGAVLRWRRGDFWGRRWVMVDTGGLPWLTFTRTPALLSLDTQVEPGEHARRDPELEPLVLLGFYLLVLMARQVHASH